MTWGHSRERISSACITSSVWARAQASTSLGVKIWQRAIASRVDSSWVLS